MRVPISLMKTIQDEKEAHKFEKEVRRSEKEVRRSEKRVRRFVRYLE